MGFVTIEIIPIQTLLVDTKVLEGHSERHEARYKYFDVSQLVHDDAEPSQVLQEDEQARNFF